MIDKIITTLKASRKVFVASHVRPDGDAVGALLAMGQVVNAMDVPVAVYNESPIPAVYRFLPGVDHVLHDPAVCDDCDTAVILDCGSFDRVGDAVLAKVYTMPMIINIDHHVTNKGYGHLPWVAAAACSTSELVYDLIEAAGIELNPQMAWALYTGIVTDTGSFRFSNTNQKAFAICERLVGLGVDPSEVSRHVYGRYSMGRIKLLNLALDAIEISANGKISMMVLTRQMLNKTGARPEDAEGLINYARRIEDVRLAALIQEDLNGNGIGGFQVSLRSNGQVDVAAIATRYGGGGHPDAAGFSGKGPIADIKAQIMALATEI